MTDGAAAPWVQDHAGVWHKRPRDDEWTPWPAKVQARTLCGEAVASISASKVHPLELPQPADDPEEMCGACPQVAS